MLLTISAGWIVLIVVAAVLVAAFIALYFLGRRLEKKRAEQEEQMAAMAQTVNMLIIDKKKMRLSEAGLPQTILEQTPKRFRRAKMPIVKGKVGPKIMSFICDNAIFDEIPVKKEVKATISGLYITGVKGLRGPLEKTEKKKKGFLARMQEKALAMQKSTGKSV